MLSDADLAAKEENGPQDVETLMLVTKPEEDSIINILKLDAGRMVKQNQFTKADHRDHVIQKVGMKTMRCVGCRFAAAEDYSNIVTALKDLEELTGQQRPFEAIEESIYDAYYDLPRRKRTRRNFFYRIEVLLLKVYNCCYELNVEGYLEDILAEYYRDLQRVCERCHAKTIRSEEFGYLARSLASLSTKDGHESTAVYP